MSGLLYRMMPGAAPVDPLAGSVMSPGYIPQGSALNPLAGVLTGLAYLTRAGLLDPAQEGLNRLPTAGGALVRAALGKQPGPVKSTMGLLGLGEAGGPGYEAGLAAGSAAGLLGGTDKAAEIAKQHAEQYRRYHAATTAPGAPATVWHGSPHKFDKFDASKIGTGEGAQAYGHGLYLADAKGTAKTYREKLASNEVTYRGQLYKPNRSATDPQSMGLNALSIESSPLDAAKKLRAAATDDTVWVGYGASDKALRPKYAAAADWLEKNAADITVNTGSIYKVDLPDEAIAKMLDWDKPLSQQPENVRKAIADLGITPGSLGKIAADKVRKLANSEGLADWARRDLLADAARLESAKSIQQIGGTLKRMPLEYGISTDSGPFKAAAQDFLSFVKATEYVPNMDTGGGSYGLLSSLRGGDAAASQYLRNYGIPGTRYLDGGSRGAGAGTSNYVVFPGEEGLLKILSRE